MISDDEEKQAPEIGLNYFVPETYNIKSKYSLGVRGIYPFVRARYSSEFQPGAWIIEPIQIFKYSVKDDFEEETQVYFDTKITDLSLFRIYLGRGTKSRIPGMRYDASCSIYWTPKKTPGSAFLRVLTGVQNISILRTPMLTRSSMKTIMASTTIQLPSPGDKTSIENGCFTRSSPV